MLVYISLFLIPCLGVLSNASLRGQGRVAWGLTLLLLAVVIGFRHQVGGDWGSYANHFLSISYLDFGSALMRGDPGYSLLNWFVAQIGGGIHLVNFVCALIFVWGLGTFCARQPRPWLGLLVSIPYLAVVVAMGYTRQGVAIGLLMLAFTKFEDRNFRWFLFYAGLAALFHKTALLLVPVAALALSHGRIVNVLLAGVLVALGYYTLIADDADTMIRVYVTHEYTTSEGGPVRALMNALPAAIFLWFRRSFVMSPESRRLWTLLSLLALASVPLVQVASIAVDRMSLYLIPLQIVVFSRIDQFVRVRGNRDLLTTGVVAYYAAVQLTWLFFASHAHAWIPYSFALFS